MPLTPGTRLGSYELGALIGQGGMGEIYRARDTRLDRTVAIKVLPAELAADPQLRERFEREARAISSLQHPNICALFDVGEAPSPEPSALSHDTVRFLVLEYLEGETLAERLARGDPKLAGGDPKRVALQPSDALKVAIEICDALDRAHRAGIVHRDLKPANIFLVRTGGASASAKATADRRSATREGWSAPPIAKLLDFGLAKSAAPVVATSGLSMLPTTPPNVTAQGTILGTFQYMAPEQIEGLEADARTDIFAFGAVLFEMLTGRTAFEGKTRASLLGAILKDEPPRVSTAQPLAPKALDRIVATCLAKDPDDRYQSARDLLRDLKWAAAPDAASVTDDDRIAGGPFSGAAGLALGRRFSGAAGWPMQAIGAVLVVALIAAGAIAIRHLRETPAPAEPIQFTIAPPPDITFATPPGGGTGFATQVAVSPDGRFVVFVGSGQSGYQLWLRSIAGLDARALPGTEDAVFPFWSPDSRYIGFFAAGKMKKMNVAGGPPIVLCDAASGRGATWNRDNVILFSPSTTTVLQRVSGAGGIPQPASALDTTYGETSHRFPSFLPDGRHFVYTGVIGTCCPALKPGRIRIGTLDSLDATTLLQVESSAAFAAGHLLFNRDGTLMAQPVDATSHQLAGDAFPIAEHIGSEGSRYASFSASATGDLVYGRGVARPTMRLTWMDRAGRTLETVGEPATYLGLALSSDERRVAVAFSSGTPENRDIWILDAARGTPTRFTFDPGDDNAPIWSPDDSLIAFQANREGSSTVRQKRVEGTTNEEPLLESGARGASSPSDWSADSRYLAFARSQGTAGSTDIWVLPLFGDRKPLPVVQTPATESAAVFAPNGRWIAYQSNESGQGQVYVQPFPPTGGKFQVSKNGGAQPIWRRDGKELFFISADSKMMAAAIDTTGAFQSGIPTALFTVTTLASQGSSATGRQYAVTRDGQRFLVNVIQQQSTAVPLTVVVKWLAAVQR